MASVFSKIVQNELQGHILYQDPVCFAILSICPLHPGHVLLIPREEISDWLQLPDKLSLHLYQTAKLIGGILRQSFPCKKVGFIMAGLEVEHLHIHLVPLQDSSNLDWSLAQRASEESLKDAALKLKEAGIEHLAQFEAQTH